MSGLHKISTGGSLDTDLLDAIHTMLEDDPDWMDRAACKGRTEDMFNKEAKDITYLRLARAICRSCPVQQQCLAYALEFPPTDMHGVWAGYTPRQLGSIQRRLGIKPKRKTIAQMWNEQ